MSDCLPEKLGKIHYLFLFAIVFTISFSFALYTNHAWEDWYITFRASKNLAMGNGLVFTVGERVHSFTSPLGTLIPALLSYITSNRSDDLVLWLFRIINCSLLGLTAIMLSKICASLQLRFIATALLLGMFTVDSKIIDFSINGQETAYMMIFLAASVYVMTVPTEKASLKLGLAWGGLMWSRPDSFVYICALALSYFIFNPNTPNFRSRRELSRAFMRAAMVTMAVYLPWTVWTWYYYGTPIPHTVTAKGLLSPPLGINLITKLLTFPYMTVFDVSSVVPTFLPPNYMFGGWPDLLLYAYGILSLLCTYYWCLPFGTPSGRAFSFACFIGQFYLSAIAPTVYAWYIPSVTLLSILVLGQIARQAQNACAAHPNKLSPFTGSLLWIGTGTILAGSIVMTLATGYQMKLQQELIESSNRKQIGLWLKANAASPQDTVFLECLGYIGFFSQLKMLDNPGMSSPEVVAARRKLQTNKYAPLIIDLQPDWLVLRPWEIQVIMETSPEVLTTLYRQEKLFDVSDRINAYRYIPGREYLQYDQTFVVFRKQVNEPERQPARID